jgi:predicted dehydrogenase
MRRIGVGVIGFGWLGQAHSRSLLRIPTLFADRDFDTELVICGDTLPERREDAVSSFGFARSTGDWRAVVEDPDVDVVVIAAPNMFHTELVEAAAAAGKHVFCEKPVGGTPEQTVRAEKAARHAGVISGVGYNYRWAPLVQYARNLIADGTLGEITNYRGRFFSMYGSDPLGVLSWRFLVDQAGYGVTTDLMSHSVDLAHMLLGPIDRVVGTTETFIAERPLPTAGGAGGTHYHRGRPEDPKGAVTNEDYAGMLCEFGSGARGTFEASRSIIGPESQMAFEVYGTKGALGWNLEKLNELQVYLVEDEAHSGYRTVFGGDRFPYHGHFVPGSANGIGFEDLVVIEDFEFCRSVASGREHRPSFGDAVEWVSVQAALLRSAESGHWEDVVSLRED